MYLVLPYNVLLGGLSWIPLPTLLWDVINECSQSLQKRLVLKSTKVESVYIFKKIHCRTLKSILVLGFYKYLEVPFYQGSFQ
jgi:hypothetical protein